MEHHAAYSKANIASREAVFSWIRTVLTILTPSLVLLIGLQNKSDELSTNEIGVLVATIISFSFTILAGLLVLKSESIGQLELRNAISKAYDNNQPLNSVNVNISFIYSAAEKAFSIFSLLSIVLVTTFGILKFVT